MNDLILNPIHTVIWAVSFVGIVISFLWMHIHKARRGYAILPLSYFLNVFFYNLALHIVYGLHTDIFTLQQLEIWSGVVRLHSLFLLIFYLVFQPVAILRARSQENKL